MAHLTICRAGGQHYRVRTRDRGCRRWDPVGGRFRTLDGAARRLAREMAKRHAIKRGEVLLCGDWYDPSPILEVIRK